MTKKEPKVKILSVKEAVAVGEPLLKKIQRLNRRIQRAKETIKKVEAQKAQLKLVCPHPKKYFSRFAYTYINEYCSLCGYNEMF